jgi:hypothetical protein
MEVWRMSQTLDLRSRTQWEPDLAHPEQPLARVRFLEGREGSLSVIEVDVPDSWNVGERLDKVLFLMRIQALAREERRITGRIVHGLRIVEFDGAPIRKSRRLELQAELLSLLGRALSREVARGAPIQA